MSKIEVRKINAETMDILINHGLVSPIRGKNSLSELKEDVMNVETFYECNEFGGHKLIAVGTNIVGPKFLHYHPGKEDVLLLSDKETKPLYMVFALEKLDNSQKPSKEMLEMCNYLVVEMLYNDPDFCCFTINPDVLHGEFTIKGVEPNPVFFVTEPSKMNTNFVELGDMRDIFINVINKNGNE